ncbi:MAG: type II toxin-antitoxin system VapC family toxin [Deltaproteobacteria bacterium]|nr:type II toxin-antitoxin system VapC family toxin [Deltaproteobacteria bacterium]
MTKALLDTNIISAFMKGNPAVMDSVSQYVKRHKHISLSIITHYELLRGLKAIGIDKKIAAFQAFMAQCEIIPLTQPIIETAAEIYAALKNQGMLIEDADILIAATAINKGMSLVTDNLEHFRRVHGLKTHNWLT